MSSDARGQALIWRQLDGLGLEHCRLVEEDLATSLDGAAVVMDAGVAWRLNYGIVCDRDWRTRLVSVGAVAGASDRALALAVGEDGRWSVDGAVRSELDGCVDVDLGFTPSTNTLPIRRVALGIGESATIDVAWVEFPSFVVQRAAQRYTRLRDRVYRFEHLTTSFVAELEVDSSGLVVVYPGLWEQVEPSREA
jgi:uncharacterized protein